jgi:hypothetical protein
LNNIFFRKCRIVDRKEKKAESVFDAEVKVGLVEDVDSDVAVLTTGCVAAAVRMEHDAVDGTEVTLDASKFFVLENLKLTKNGWSFNLTLAVVTR